MCFFWDAFKAEVSLKNIKGKALSHTIAASHQHVFAFVIPGIKIILKYLSSNVYSLSAFFTLIFLLCKPPTVVWHKNAAEDEKTFQQTVLFISSFCSVHHLFLALCFSHFTVSTPQQFDFLSYQQNCVLFRNPDACFSQWRFQILLYSFYSHLVFTFDLSCRIIKSHLLFHLSGLLSRITGTSPTYPLVGGTIPSTMMGTSPTHCSMSSPTPMEEAGRRLVHICVRWH